MAQSKEIDELVNIIISKPHWHVNIKPKVVIPERIDTIKQLWNLMETCRVTLRGWDYPHVDREKRNRGYGANWIASWCKFFMGHQEYWQFFQSAEFRHYFSFWEDGDSDEAKRRAKLNIPLMPNDFIPSGYLSVLSTLYSFTEIFEFAARLANKGIFEHSVLISVRMSGIQNRALFFWDVTRILKECYYSTETRLERTLVIKTEDLIQKSKDYALKTMLWFFERFQWLDPPINLLKDEQNKFIKRRIL